MYSVRKSRAVVYFIILLLVYIPSVYSKGVWKPAAALLNHSSQEKVMVCIAQQSNSVIELKYKIPKPAFKDVTYQKIGGSNTSRCVLGNTRLYSIPTEPEIPFVYSRVILPAGYTVAYIRVIPHETQELSNSFLLSYGEYPQRLSSNKVARAEANRLIYDSDEAYPEKNCTLSSIGRRCGVAIANINIFPLTYYPRSGKISYLKRFSLRVQLKPDKGRMSDIKARPKRLLKGIVTEENPEALNTFSSPPVYADNYQYVIIAKQSFIDAPIEPSLHDLIEHRKLKGLTCKIEAIDTIGCDSTRLRNAIKKYYNDWNTEYVLLVGDIEHIPVTRIWDVTTFTPTPIPTDKPYQCLDQSEWNEDFEAELFIGRFSVNDPTELSNQIYKTIQYERVPISDNFVTTALSLGEMLDPETYGKEAMLQLQQCFSGDWTFDCLFDKDVKWDKSQLIQKVNSNTFSIINHDGHANNIYCMRLENGDESQLTNTKPIFAKSPGCYSGNFELDCIAERLTSSTRTGLFGCVFNSRFGWYKPGAPLQGSSYQVHRAFWEGCWNEDLDYFGVINEYSHRVMYTQFHYDCLQTNLFGDPAVKLIGKDLTPYIRVSIPKGGEKWERNRAFEIKWDYNIADNVTIELLKGEMVQEVLASSVPGNGLYTWDISDDIPLADDYKIRITTDTIVDQSDSFFAVVKRSHLTLVTPNGGGTYLKDREYTITWNDSLNGKVRLDLIKSGSLCRTITDSTENSGSFTWKVPQRIKNDTDYTIRITVIDKPWLYDESDNTITIESPIVTVPYFQDFDSFIDTGTISLSAYWIQLEEDSADWTLWQGPTPSRLCVTPNETGPLGDHTSGKGKYLYAEASDNENTTMHIASPVFTFDSVITAELSFYYHMFDLESFFMGTLHMDIWDGLSWKNDVVTISGSQGDKWHKKSFNMNSYAGKEKVQIRFRGDIGNGWRSDICIDDFNIAVNVGINENIALNHSFYVRYFKSCLYYQLPDLKNKMVHVTIMLYDLHGRLIKTLENERKKSGRHLVNLNSGQSKLATGLYMVTFKAGPFKKVMKIVHL